MERSREAAEVKEDEAGSETSRRRHRHKKHKKEKKSRKHKRKHKHTSGRSRSDSESSSSSWSSSSDSSKESRKNRKHHKDKHKDRPPVIRHREDAKSEDLVESIPQTSNKYREEGDDDDAYGPVAPFALSSGTLNVTTGGYGGHLLAGEGEAIAAFVQNNERIPRRGEVGWDGDKIKKLEDLGYVMSGSRHKKMEAVRKRKENQVISAEEKRLLLINDTKMRQEKEDKVLEEMRHLIKKKEHQEAAGHI